MKPQRLNLSSSSAGTHLCNIEQKRGLFNQAEMTLLAARHGLIDVTSKAMRPLNPGFHIIRLTRRAPAHALTIVRAQGPERQRRQQR